ncbi:hypothetical protein EDC04DRAFT_2600267 [Pisolithus marmoratus]|nr:hypothetical protein EDC04DRAFT_2600267 [Pisolithus marmoratus]
MWKFDELHKVAIQHLDQPFSPFNIVNKFTLTSKYEVAECFLPALLALARQSKLISVEERCQIEFEYALKVAAVREELKMMRVMNSIPRIYHPPMKDPLLA